jgi:hypothetical protein
LNQIDPDARLRWLSKLAQDFPETSSINMTLFWENDFGSAGVYSYPNESYVFLFNAQQRVESLAEATNVLRGIFAGEIVAVSAYAKDQLVFTGLAPANDPSGGFNILDTPAKGDMPNIDHVTIESWTNGLQETG